MDVEAGSEDDNCNQIFGTTHVRFGVKTGKARSEHKISALPLKADIGADIVFVRSVPGADITSQFEL